jgi:hypothetical protein
MEQNKLERFALASFLALIFAGASYNTIAYLIPLSTTKKNV